MNSIGKAHTERIYSKKTVLQIFYNFRIIDEFNFSEKFFNHQHALTKISNLYHGYILEKEYNDSDDSYSSYDDDYY